MAIIPHTWESTSLKYLSVGALVNLEADLMAKYAESILGKMGDSHFPLRLNPPPAVTKEWLASNGWLEN